MRAIYGSAFIKCIKYSLIKNMLPIFSKCKTATLRLLCFGLQNQRICNGCLKLLLSTVKIQEACARSIVLVLCLRTLHNKHELHVILFEINS